MVSTTGLTKDAGWQLGIRRTVAVPLEVAWRALLDAVGVAASEPGAEFVTASGVRGQVRSHRGNTMIRMTWQPPGQPESTLQLRVIPAKTGTTIAVHQDHLRSAEERAVQLEHWTGVMDTLRATLEK